MGRAKLSLAPETLNHETEPLHREIGLSTPDATLPLRLLYVGTVCETKGILVLLNACRQLQERNDRVVFELRVVGSFQPASFQTQIEELIAEFGIADKVTLCGQLVGDEKFSEFAAADIFCFPSHYESEAFSLCAG